MICGVNWPAKRRTEGPRKPLRTCDGCCRIAGTTEKDAAKRLERSLEINQPLQCAYLLKEELGELWQQDDGRKAWAFLREWAAKATASGIRQLQAMAKTLLSHAKGILSFTTPV